MSLLWNKLNDLHFAGGPWGSCEIDKKFFLLLEYLFGEETLEELQQNDHKTYVVMMRLVEKAKILCQKNRTGSELESATIFRELLSCWLVGKTFGLGPFPSNFIRFLERKKGKKFPKICEDAGDQVEKLLGNSAYTPPKSHICFKRSTLLISHEFAKGFLVNPVLLPIISHLKNLMAENEIENKEDEKKTKNLLQVSLLKYSRMFLFLCFVRTQTSFFWSAHLRSLFI